jgi:ABC-type Fe3+-hydroxamate transport system substrate-binding protein
LASLTTIFLGCTVFAQEPSATPALPSRRNSAVKDSLGRPVPFPSKRVIALSPALTEMIFALELADKLVGRSDFSNFPPEASQKPSVGPYTRPSIEKIVTLKPDLVLVPQEGPEGLQKRFDQLKIPYAVVKMKQIDDIPHSAIQIGAWLGQAKAGKKFKTAWNKALKEIFKNPIQEKKPGVLIEIQHEPLIVAGTGTFLGEAVIRCGGINLFSDAEGYPKVSRELLFKKKIDIVLLADHFNNEADKFRTLKKWEAFPPTKDVFMKSLDPDTATRPGPRLIEGFKEICRALNEWGYEV